MKSTEKIIAMEKMYCKDCPEIIKSGIISMKGVKDVGIDMELQKMYVDFDPEKISAEEINKELKEITKYLPKWCWMWRLLKGE